MEGFTEICALGTSIYYLYKLITEFKHIKGDTKFYEDHKTMFIISFIGVICLIFSFQIYWFTDFYDEHKYISVLIKIILGVFSLFNQILISDIDEELYKDNSKKKKDDDYDELFNKPTNKKMIFKLINRLYLLDIALKLFSKKNHY